MDFENKLERVRGYLASRADASCEPGEDRYHANEEMSLLNDVETLEASLKASVRRVVVEQLEPSGTPARDARVACLAQNLGIDLFNDSAAFLPPGYRVGP